MLVMLIIRCSFDFHADITTYRNKKLTSQFIENFLQIIVLKLGLCPVQGVHKPGPVSLGN